MTQTGQKGKTKQCVDQAIEKLYAFSEGINESIYVLNPETHEIIFTNSKTREMFGKNIDGKKCYKVFQRLDHPCSECTNKYVFGKNLGKTYVGDHQNRMNGRWYRGIYKAILLANDKWVKYGMAIDITNQKKMEEKLHENEEFFHSVVETSLNTILIVDNKHRIVYVNQEAERLAGYSKREMLGRDFRKLLAPECREPVGKNNVWGTLRSRQPIQLDFLIVRKDGKRRNVEARCTALRYNCGTPCTIVQLSDVTERRFLEAERDDFEEKLSALSFHGQRLNMAKNTQEIFAITLGTMRKTLGHEFADIFMIEGKSLRLMAHRGYSKDLSLKLPLSSRKGMTVRVARTGKAILVSNVRKVKAYLKGGEGIRSELAVPMKIGRQVLGVLNVESRKLAFFVEKDRRLLEILASRIAVALTNLRRQEQLKEISKKLECLMRNTTQVMHAKTMCGRLKVIAKTMRKLGWRRVVISLRDENLVATEFVTSGLTKQENDLLRRRKASGQVWQERFGPKFARFRIGEFYYLPWSSSWVRENVHGLAPGSPSNANAMYAGIPSRLSPEEMVDWHPQDMLYAPLLTPEGRIVGILSMDDPVDGCKPTRLSLAPLELFLHQAAIVIENAQLIESLKGARGFLEQKVEERTCELRISQEQLLRAQRLAVIGELAGMVGHDLRNPLTSIAGATYYMQKQLGSSSNEKIAEMLDLIGRNIAYSNKIINDLLDYSRELKLDLTDTSPKLLLKQSLELIGIPANVQLLNLTKDVPRFKADIEKMQRAFVNIIRNAVDAMPNGGRLSIKSRKIGSSLEFSFSDTGVGITKEAMKRLWIPLFTTKAKGMGFGLPISKRIVEAHGGSISAKSASRRGTTFIVTLPIEQASEQKEGGEKIWIASPESLLLTTTKT